MSYDGIVLRAVALELNTALQGARIDKIFQPTSQEVILVLRQPGATYKLLLSTHAQESGIYLSTRERPNPLTPPLFCMVMRKHLEGGKILAINQMEFERILEINCSVTDELGDRVIRKIIVEIMGKHSNIILLEPQENRIIDAIKKITLSISSYRQVLPGITYHSPPPQDKIKPGGIKERDFFEKIMSLPLTRTLNKAILQTFTGFGPQTSQEIVVRTGLDPSLPLEYCGEYELSKLWQVFQEITQSIEAGIFQPELALVDEIPIAFSAITLTQFPLEQRRPFPTMNQALDYYYSHRQQLNILQQRKGQLLQVIKKETDRCEKKAGLQLQTIQESQNAEQYRLWGELLTASLHQLKQGKEAVVINYYDPQGGTEIIPLTENRTPSENAQNYFSKYQKAKNSARKAEIQLQETQGELQYLSSLSISLDNIVSLQELDEIKEELVDSGYLKAAPLKKAKKQLVKENSLPQKVIMESWEIYYGRNNKQNDLLTMKIAKANDLWFHTKDIPGAHVIIKNPGDKEIPAPVLETASLLAAYFSRARGSNNVPVDYTMKKHVWKLKGAKPGMVQYENQRTIFVTPAEDTIKDILKTPLLEE